MGGAVEYDDRIHSVDHWEGNIERGEGKRDSRVGGRRERLILGLVVCGRRGGSGGDVHVTSSPASSKLSETPFSERRTEEQKRGKMR